MKSIIKLFLIIILLNSYALIAHEQSIPASKATYNVVSENHQYQFTLWMDSKHLAIRYNQDNRMMLWENWQGSYPTLHQLFLKEKYSIEFETAESIGFKKLYKQIKLLIDSNQFVDKKDINGKAIEVAKKTSAESIAQEIKSWDVFTNYDYADIGDNEADPILARLIHQGFKPQL